MKKKKLLIIIASIIIIIILAIILTFALKRDELPFKNNFWINVENEMIEDISLYPNGEFLYYTNQDDSLNLSTCKKYKYNKKTDTLKLSCSKEAKINEIKIISYSEKELVLDIDGEEKTFKVSET